MKTKTHRCPDCNELLYCGCEKCLVNGFTPDDVIPYEVLDEELGVIQCPICMGEFTMEWIVTSDNDRCFSDEVNTDNEEDILDDDETYLN